jgi:hypothetical protein
LTMWIFLIHGYSFWLLNLILWRMYTFNNCHLIPVIRYLCYLEVVWSWKKTVVLMANCVLNVPAQICNSIICTPKNHGIQMQSKDQHLQISKWNFCSTLLRFLGWILEWITWAP